MSILNKISQTAVIAFTGAATVADVEVAVAGLKITLLSVDGDSSKKTMTRTQSAPFLKKVDKIWAKDKLIEEMQKKMKELENKIKKKEVNGNQNISNTHGDVVGIGNMWKDCTIGSITYSDQKEIQKLQQYIQKLQAEQSTEIATLLKEMEKHGSNCKNETESQKWDELHELHKKLEKRLTTLGQQQETNILRIILLQVLQNQQLMMGKMNISTLRRENSKPKTIKKRLTDTPEPVLK